VAFLALNSDPRPFIRLAAPVFRAALALLFLLGEASKALAQETPQPQGQGRVPLRELTLDELSTVEVTSVSRRSEPAWRTPAAISVITQEDIRRAGVQSIPEALRLANGLQVARSSNTNWAISARGFNITTANKMQVFLDGRNLYSPLFGGVLWDQVDVLISDIDRIEVIRGPAGALWGGNSVNGVINIITKSTKNTLGGLVHAGGGFGQRGFVSMRYGDVVGNNVFYRVYGKFFQRDSLRLNTGADAANEFRYGQGGFRTDIDLSALDLLTVQGDLYSGDAGVLNRPDTGTHGGNILSRWTRRFQGGSELQLQASYDRSSRFVAETFNEIRYIYEVEAQHVLPVNGRQDIVWGIGYRVSTNRTLPEEVLFFEPSGRHLGLFGLFLEDDISFYDGRLHLTFGSRLENNTYTDWEVYPNVRLAWIPSEEHTMWGAVSRAVRIPTQFDRDLRIDLPPPAFDIRGTSDFDSEKVVAYEIGYRTRVFPRLLLGLSAYFNDYDDLRSQERFPDESLILLSNRLRGHTYGLEAGVTYDLLPWWRLRAGYTNLQKDLELEPGSTDINRGRGEGVDPRNQFQFRSQMDLPHQTELHFWLRHVSSLGTSPPAVPVPAYTVFDVRAGWNPTETLELSVVGRNLPRRRRAEFGPNGQLVPRELYGIFSWRF